MLAQRNSTEPDLHETDGDRLAAGAWGLHTGGGLHILLHGNANVFAVTLLALVLSLPVPLLLPSCVHCQCQSSCHAAATVIGTLWLPLLPQLLTSKLRFMPGGLSSAYQRVPCSAHEDG